VTSDHRITPGFIHDTLDALERHDDHRSDEHAGDAIERIGDVARQDREAVILARANVSTVFAAPDIAADYKRDRAAACAVQTWLTCQSRLRDAQAYDRLAGQILHAAEASPAATEQPGPGHTEPACSQPQATADPQAGQ